MKAYEQKKNGCFDIGRVWMVVEGKEADVRKVEAILKKDYASDGCEDNEGDGNISIGFVVDRNEVKDFMFDYKAAKGA